MQERLLEKTEGQTVCSFLKLFRLKVRKRITKEAYKHTNREGRRGKTSDIDPGPRVCGVPSSLSRASTQMSLKIAAFFILWSILPPPSTPTWSGLLLAPLLPTGNHYTQCETLHQSPLSPELHLLPIRRRTRWLLATASLNSFVFLAHPSIVFRICSNDDIG